MEKIDSRYDLPRLFKEMGGIKKGIELGVSHGDFSHYLVDNHDSWDILYGVDEYVERWGGDRDEKLYYKVVESFSSNPNYTLLKMRFSEAAKQFSDEFFDFIFVDGAEGFENGETLDDWYPKLRVGGVFAGRAYDSKFPQQIKLLDLFLRDNNISNKLIILNETDGKDFVKNWFFIK